MDYARHEKARVVRASNVNCALQASAHATRAERLRNGYARVLPVNILPVPHMKHCDCALRLSNLIDHPVISASDAPAGSAA